MSIYDRNGVDVIFLVYVSDKDHVCVGYGHQPSAIKIMSASEHDSVAMIWLCLKFISQARIGTYLF